MPPPPGRAGRFTDLPLGAMENFPVRNTHRSPSGMLGAPVTVNAFMYFAQHTHTHKCEEDHHIYLPLSRSIPYSPVAGRERVESRDLNPILNSRSSLNFSLLFGEHVHVRREKSDSTAWTEGCPDFLVSRYCLDSYCFLCLREEIEGLLASQKEKSVSQVI